MAHTLDWRTLSGMSQRDKQRPCIRVMYSPSHCSCTCPISSPSSAISPLAQSPDAFAVGRQSRQIVHFGSKTRWTADIAGHYPKSAMSTLRHLFFNCTGSRQLLLTGERKKRHASAVSVGSVRHRQEVSEWQRGEHTMKKNSNHQREVLTYCRKPKRSVTL